MNPRAPVTLEVYCEALKQLRRAIQNRWHGLMSSGVVLLHDNVRTHTAVHTIQLQKQFQWELFNHLLYSPDLVPSDFHLFLHLRTFRAWPNFTDGKELK
jgi:histone-lysine N-methyltransferase SETMAR